MNRFLSRKFLTMIGGVITILLIQFFGADEGMARDVVSASIAVIVGVYNISQGMVDAAEKKNPQ